ncbi:MAG TPA: hypothetical protein VEU11_00545 [Terriglobales bacterium]|nr:hypothetical protein [Terriglobales bacterium]
MDTEKSPESGRRSTRIRAQILLRITSLDPAAPFSETGHTLVLNTQGCGVRLSCPLQPGVAVSLDDLPIGKSVTARVANCVPLGTGGQWWMVGIALDEPGNVWGIHPAPADWGSDAAPASAAVAAPSASPAKSGEWPFHQFSSRGEFHPGKR